MSDEVPDRAARRTKGSDPFVRLFVEEGVAGVEHVAVAHGEDDVAEAHLAEAVDGDVDAAGAGFGGHALAGPAGREDVVDVERFAGLGAAALGEGGEDAAERAAAGEIDA